MRKPLRKFVIALLMTAFAALGLPFSSSPANGLSQCQQLRNELLVAANSSGQYGTPVPDLCTKDCPEIYNYYTSVSTLPNYDSVLSSLMALYAACNVQQVPPSGVPNNVVIVTPDNHRVPCPKIIKDMHGRKDFAHTNCLSGKTLAGFNLSGMDLNGANLRSANLTGADLSNTKFSNADLSRAVLDFANVQGANFGNAIMNDLRAAKLKGSPYSLPWNWKLVNGLFLGPHVDLTRTWLKGLRLSDVDLSYANLTSTNLEGAKLTNVTLYQSKFTPVLNGTVTSGLKGQPATWNVQIVNGFLIASGVDLSGANLSYADLRALKLKDVSFKRANLAHARFTDANLDHCDLSYANLDSTELANTKLIGGFSSNYVYGTPKSLPVGWSFQDHYLRRN